MTTLARSARFIFRDWFQAMLALGGIGLVVVSIYPDWLALGFGGFGPKQLAGLVLGGAAIGLALGLMRVRQQPQFWPQLGATQGSDPTAPAASQGGAQRLVSQWRVLGQPWWAVGLGLGLTAAVAALVALAAARIVTPLWSQTLDDTYITLRYSRNLVEGYGLRWNPTDAQPVEGFTSLTHVLLGSALLSAGLDPVQGTKVVGLVSIALIVALGGWHARRQGGGPVSFGVATLLLVGNPFLFFAAIQGMDTMLAALAVTVITALVYASWQDERWLPELFAAMVGAVLTRPDTGLLVILYLLPVFLKYRARPRFWRSAALLLVLPGLLYIAFKLIYFGDLLPTTFYFKSRVGQWPQLDLVLSFAGRFMVPALPVLAAWVITRQARWAELYVTGALCLAIGYFATVRPAVAIGYRFLIPFLPALVLGLIRPMQDLARMAGAPHLPGAKRALAAGIVGGLLLLVVPTPSQYAADAAGLRVEALRMDPIIGRALANLPEPQSIRLVTGDAGAIPYFSNMYHVDPYGLVTKDPRTNPFSADLVFENPPDIFVTHTLAIEVGADGELVIDYEPIRWFLDYPDVGTAKFSIAIITDPRFADYALAAKLPSKSEPSVIDYHYVFLRKSSPYYDILQARVAEIELPR